MRTGANVSFYSVFGDDHNAEWLRQACLSEGLRIDHSVSVTGASSVYMAVHDTDGDMLCAVNDMRLMDGFTPDILAPMLPSVNRADVCVIDANLPVESLLYLAERAAIPLVCDPVSAEKAQRIIPLMKHLSALKPNLLEAQSMTGETTPEGETTSDFKLSINYAYSGKSGPSERQIAFANELISTIENNRCSFDENPMSSFYTLNKTQTSFVIDYLLHLDIIL